jgi:hypothetical protein
LLEFLVLPLQRFDLHLLVPLAALKARRWWRSQSFPANPWSQCKLEDCLSL